MFARVHPDTLGSQSSAADVSRVLGSKVRICVLGGTKFFEAESEQIVTRLAQELGDRLGQKATFITGGMEGVQLSFARNCRGASLFNLLPRGQSSNYGVGTDVEVGKDLEERKEVFGRIGHVYICVEGGPGVAQEARCAFDLGHYVVPVMRTGGASSGACGFPPAALERPFFAKPWQWALLQDKTATIDDTVRASAAIVEEAARLKSHCLGKLEARVRACMRVVLRSRIFRICSC